MITSIIVPVVNSGAPTVSAATVPGGFTDVQVAAPGASTGIVGLPDGTVMVLVQSGSVRLIRGDVMLPSPALNLSLSPCNGGERGLLGVAVDPHFKANGYVYLYFTHPAAAPGGCVNRASRFTMTGDAIDPNSEVVLVDNISSEAGNHNGGDLEIGGDGYLYISVGDAGADPRTKASPSNAGQDLSLLNGKILRVVPSTGDPAPGNPFSGRRHGQLPGARQHRRRRRRLRARRCSRGGCATRSGSRSTPTPGLTGSSSTTSARAPARRSTSAGSAANYGWPIREGVCPQRPNPPCPAPRRYPA